MTFFGDKTDVAQFVVDLLSRSSVDYQSITIMSPKKSGGCYVLLAINSSLEGIVANKAQSFSLRVIIT